MTGDQQPSDINSQLAKQLDVDLALQAAGVGVWEVNLLTDQVQWDSRCGELFGLTKPHLSYADTLRYIHPDDLIQVTQAIQWAMDPQSGGHYEQTYRALGEDGHTRWIRSVGRNYFTDTGQPIRFTGIAQQVRERQQMVSSEVRLRSVIQQTPAATLVLQGDDYHIEYINSSMLAFMRRGGEVIGQPFLSVMPELAGQFAWQQVKRVYEQGVDFNQEAVLVSHYREGMAGDYYYDVAYRPLKEEELITGVIQVVTDVTEQVKVQQALKENQAVLQSIIDLAELDSYRIDVATNRISKSTRTAHWYGLPEETDVGVSLGAVHEDDRERVGQVLAKALSPGSDGAYQVEYTIINQQTGFCSILRTNGQVRQDSAGNPMCIDGVVLDITPQRSLQLALEQQVQLRTEELAAANEELSSTIEELSASNEEYAAINEELTEATELLTRSNDNLQKFAYVASHDLQEPLRKIQSFGDVLKSRYADQLGDGIDYLERMQVAAGRMSTLIRDLLTFSRISTQPDTSEAVSLAQVVATAVADLDLLIQETGAVVVIEPLPVVQGDFSQLGQLFQNLLSNALKFRRPDILPLINVSVQTLAASQLPVSIFAGRTARMYHRIDVSDNGIGFDEKYLDRIFQVFQRLHGKGDFSGTGIGLAICEKVVANHGGAITARSQVGQGATFTVYLPM